MEAGRRQRTVEAARGYGCAPVWGTPVIMMNNASYAGLGKLIAYRYSQGANW